MPDSETPEDSASIVHGEIESEYYKFFDFPSETLLTRYTTFVPFFKGCNRVLDLGCGRGEFMTLLKEAGINPMGLDSDRGMVKLAQDRGFDVVYADLFEFLKTTTQTFDGIFAAHLIEHLHPDGVVEFLTQCHRCLNPGGVVVLVTPNIASVDVQGREFWRDATHTRPYTEEIVRFFVHNTGFELGQSGTNPLAAARQAAALCPQTEPEFSWPPSREEYRFHRLKRQPNSLGRIWKVPFRWVRQVGRFLFVGDRIDTLTTQVLDLEYNLISLYPPNEIFVVGRKDGALAGAEVKPQMDQVPALSIVIPNWNGKRFLDTCLGSLRIQTSQDFETIVVDNGSTDGSVEYMREKYPEVRIVEHADNLGFAKAANAGILAARAPAIFLLNNDTELDKACIANILKALVEYPKTSFFSCKMLSFSHRYALDGTGDCMPTSMNPFRRAWMRRDSALYAQSDLVFAACAGAAVYRRSALDEVGLFDEDFFCYYEDVDLSWRLQIGGHICRYLADTVVYHIGSATTGSVMNAFVAEKLARNKVLMLTKCLPVRLLLFNLIPIVFGELQRIRTFVRAKLLGAYFGGLIKGFKVMPQMLKKRKEIFANRKVTWDYVQTCFEMAGPWEGGQGIISVEELAAIENAKKTKKD